MNTNSIALINYLREQYMKNLIITMMTLTSLLISKNALADVTPKAGWSGVSTITGIYAIDAERVLIKLSNFANPGNCAVNNSGDVIINSVTHRNWFAMALSAYTASKPVDFYLSSSCTPLWSGTSFANVGHMRLK